jgi:phage gp45-like
MAQQKVESARREDVSRDIQRIDLDLDEISAEQGLLRPFGNSPAPGSSTILAATGGERRAGLLLIVGPPSWC